MEQWPALVGGDLALDLANTVEGPRGGAIVRDWLPDYDALAQWAAHARAIEPATAAALVRRAREKPRAARAVHAEATALRGTVSAVFTAVADGAEPPPEALGRLVEAEREALTHAALRPSGDRYRLAWSGEDLGLAWWPVAHAALDLLRSERLARLKGCGRCCWLFVDETKNRSRRWCSMADCGTTEKLERRAAARAASRR